MAVTLADLLASPDHYLHSFEGDTALFAPMSRAAYQRSIFLDGRILPARDGTMRLPLSPFKGHVPPAAATSWIFHVAHCGSTLLARALDHLETNLVLREPLALRQIALAPDADRLALVSAMLSKRYRADLPNVVKANVPVNFLLPQLATQDPAARAILLYLDLPDYLMAILRSADHRAWLQRVTQQLAPHLGDVTGLSDAERAAALWLAQVRAFAVATTVMPHARSLNAECFFADPETTLAAAAVQLAVPMDEATVSAVIKGPLFASYSKNPTVAFNNVARLQRRQALAPSLAQEIAAAETWIARHGADAATMMQTLEAKALVP